MSETRLIIDGHELSLAERAVTALERIAKALERPPLVIVNTGPDAEADLEKLRDDLAQYFRSARDALL